MEPLRLTLPPAGTEVKVTPEPGQAFALAFSVLDMRFERGGRNLYIIAPDGAELIIMDYFARTKLSPFYTEKGKLVSGPDFLMVMNPEMDLTVSGPLLPSRGARFSIFSTPDNPWDEGVFYALATEDGIPDYGYRAEWNESGTGAPASETGYVGNGNVHYWIGRDACQGRAFIQGLEGSITVILTASPGAAVKPFIAYVAMNGEDAPVSDCCELEDSGDCESNLFQDGPMGRASTSLIRRADNDVLILAAEGFYSFQAYYGGWLSVNFLSLQVRGVHILLNAPSGQAMVDLEDYFGSSVFSGVEIEWSYGEGHTLSNSLAEYADNGFNLVDFIDALEAEEVQLAVPHADGKEADDDTRPPRIENVVLVDPETKDAIRLKDEWDADTQDVADTATFTLDEQTLLIQGDAPEEETKGPGGAEEPDREQPDADKQGG